MSGLTDSKTMKTSIVLNAESGTLRDADIDRVGRLIESAFSAAGHETVSYSPSDRPIHEALREAVGEDSDCLLVGGGDGSVSAAAALAWEHGKILAVLPGGTMNLYARTLGLPLDVDECVHALADGHVIGADIATANGRPFVHQFTVGIHANAVRLREGMRYNSKLGKLIATVGAFYRAVLHPATFNVRIDVDGRGEEPARLSALSVSNNLFGEGHLPFADDPAGGTLGVYRGDPAGFLRTARMVVDIVLGTARANENISVGRATRVTLRFPPRRRRLAALIDGELIRPEACTEIALHPRALRVLVPAARSARAPSEPLAEVSQA